MQATPLIFRLAKHLDAQQNAVRLECNLCHSVPVLANAGQFTTNIEIVRGPEPPTHSHSSWIALHGQVIDVTCARCHPPKNPKTDYTKLNGSKPPADGSFCGNSLCHGTDWKYMGYKAKEVQPILTAQREALLAANPLAQAPVETPVPSDNATAPGAGSTGKVTYQDTLKPALDSVCGSCHAGSSAMANLDLSTYQSLLDGNSTGKGITPGDLTNSLIYTKQDAGGHYGQLSAEQMTAEAQKARRIMLHESIDDLKRMKASGEVSPESYLARLKDLRAQLAHLVLQPVQHLGLRVDVEGVVHAHDFTLNTCSTAETPPSARMALSACCTSSSRASCVMMTISAVPSPSTSFWITEAMLIAWPAAVAVTT